jgi:hypothetical protein
MAPEAAIPIFRWFGGWRLLHVEFKSALVFLNPPKAHLQLQGISEN